MGSNCILHVKYGIGEKNITVQETEDAEDDRVESKTIYHLSVPLQSAKRVEKGYDGHVIFMSRKERLSRCPTHIRMENIRIEQIHALLTG